jgi:hypothetical protein
MAAQSILRFRNFAIVSALLWAALGTPGLQAQVRIVNGGPPAVNRPLNMPPMVSGIPNHYAPHMANPPASVTSISPYNFNTPRYTNNYGYGYRNRFNNCKGYGCGYGYGGYGYGGVAIPYYYVYPAYDEGYDGYGGGSGPYLYSGPPQGQAPPADQTLHVIVDTAPQRQAVTAADLGPQYPPAAPAPISEAKPGVPTTLVYRDGHKQAVTNYAIMGQTLYVFDNRTRKIALADLDIPATVKLNEEDGVEFLVPKEKPPVKPPKTSGVPLENTPGESPKSSTVFSSTP